MVGGQKETKTKPNRESNRTELKLTKLFNWFVN